MLSENINTEFKEIYVNDVKKEIYHAFIKHLIEIGRASP